MGVRIAHFSDLHYGHGTLEESDRCFRYAVSEAMTQGVDLAVISGDATHHALESHAPALAALAAQVRRLLDHCPVLLLQGTYSHEPPGALALFRLMGGKYPVYVADRLEQVVLTRDRDWIRSPSWRFDQLPPNAMLLCSCVPTLNKSALAAAVGAADAATAMGEELEKVLRGFAVSNGRARDLGIPTIGIGHGTVRDCETEHGVPMAGLDHEFTAGGLFSAGASAFMLGHIHLHQAWTYDSQVIAYAGSIGRYHYGERGAKGFLVWDVDAGGASFEPITTPARDMVEFAFDGLPDMEELESWVATHDVSTKWIRIRWSYLEEEHALIDRARIESLFHDAAGLKLEGRMVPLCRSRAAGINQCHTLDDKIRAWAALAHVDATPLIECVGQLQHHAPDDIARRILLSPTLAPCKSPTAACRGDEPLPTT